MGRLPGKPDECAATDRAQADAAVQRAVERFGHLDRPVNNTGLTLLGPVVRADSEEWDRMIAINAKGLRYTTHAALASLRTAADDDPRQVADIVNISPIAGRVARSGYGVHTMTNFGVNDFTEALRPEVTRRHVVVNRRAKNRRRGRRRCQPPSR